MTVDIRSRPADPVAPPAGSLQPPTVGLLVQLGLLAALGAGPGLGAAGWLAGIGYALATWALLGQARRRPGGVAWGPADSVTHARAILVGGVTALVADSFWAPQPAPLAALVSLAAVALLLDGVDGAVARRTGTSSQFGARFDMETDAVLVLVLSIFVAGALGVWVLLLGLPRYAYAVATWAAPWLRAPLPPRRSRKVVAATQGVTLLAVSTSLLPASLAVASLGAVLAVVMWSFGKDIGWLWQRRHLHPAQVSEFETA